MTIHLIVSPQPLRIFLSSTWEDLRKERATVIHALHIEKPMFLALGIPFDFTGMEFFGSQTPPPREVMLAELRRCNYYIGIIAERYGSIDTITGYGMTELEYRSAFNQVDEIHVYMKDMALDIIVDRDPDKYKKLSDFKRLLDANHTNARFTTPEQLEQLVVQDLAKFVEKRYPRTQTPTKSYQDLQTLELRAKNLLQSIVLFEPNASFDALVVVSGCTNKNEIYRPLTTLVTSDWIQYDDTDDTRVCVRDSLVSLVQETLRGKTRREKLERFVRYYFDYLSSKIVTREKYVTEESDPDSNETSEKDKPLATDGGSETIADEDVEEIVIEGYEIERENLNRAKEYSEEIGLSDQAEQIVKILKLVQVRRRQHASELHT
ncbi:MAG: DUF4062 domain-containing protein [Chloroflexi bacterium]|nr:DUF4062 domain-containing protein [Chloroflexota bacterium]